jgi:hypothetical protein
MSLMMLRRSGTAFFARPCANWLRKIESHDCCDAHRLCRWR